jgi:pentatricopeptide repeat protein
MLRLGARSGRALAEVNVLPVFLCPRLLNVDVVRIRRQRPPNRQRQQNFASTSKIGSLSTEINLLLDEETQARSKPSAEYAAIISRGMDPKGKVTRPKLKESRAIDDLAITHEVVDDIIKREQAFNSKAESNYLLDEGKAFITSQLGKEREASQDLTQSLAAKLAFAYLKLDQPTKTIAIALECSKSWTKEDEEKYWILWKPIVSLAYEKGLFDESSQMSHMLSIHSKLSGNWMSLARLQSLLRISEQRQQGRRKDIYLADTLWKMYERDSIAIPEAAMFILLDSQVRRNDIEKVTQTLNVMQKYSMQITSDVFKVLFWHSVRGKSKREIRRMIVDSMDNASLVAEDLVNNFAKESKLRDCLRAMRMFGIPTRSQDIAKSTVKPTFKTCSSIIKLLLKSQQPRHVYRLLNLALKADCQGDYTSLFIEINNAFNEANKGEEVLNLGMSLLDSPLRYVYSPPATIDPLCNPSAIVKSSGQVYGALLSSISQLSNFNRIVPATRYIFLEMYLNDLKPDRFVRKALTKVVTRLGQEADAGAVIRYLNRLFIRHQGENVEEWSKFVDVMQQEGVADELTLEAWERSKPSSPGKYLLDSIAYTQSKALLGIPFHRQNQYSSVEDVVDTANGSETKEVAQRIAFKDLHLDVHLTPAAYAMRLRVFAVIRREFNNALLIYQSMVANGVKPTMHHIAPLVEGLVLLDRLTDAQMIIERAKVEFPGSVIPLRLYAALIRGCGQKQDWQGMLQVAAEMREEKIQINRYIQIALQTAKRILRRQAKEASGKGDGPASAQLTGFTEQPLPKRRKQTKPESVKEVTFAFIDFHRTGQSLVAQGYISRALDDGLEPDGFLRDTLSRCDNWIRKKMKATEGQETKERQYNYLKECLRQCRSNRERMKVSEEEEKAVVALRKQEEKQRVALIYLLKSALASKKLWREAHSRKYRNKVRSMRKSTTL